MTFKVNWPSLINFAPKSILNGRGQVTLTAINDLTQGILHTSRDATTCDKWLLQSTTSLSKCRRKKVQEFIVKTKQSNLL